MPTALQTLQLRERDVQQINASKHLPSHGGRCCEGKRMCKHGRKKRVTLKELEGGSVARAW